MATKLQTVFDAFLAKMLEDDWTGWSEEEVARDLVEIFGEIHHFMYINSVTVNYTSYFGDSNHAYPETNAIVAKDLSTFITIP